MIVLRSDPCLDQLWMYQNTSSGHHRHMLQVSAMRTDRKSPVHFLIPPHYFLYECTESFSTRILIKCMYLLVLLFVLEFKDVHTLVFSSLEKWIKESAGSSQSGCLYLHWTGSKHRRECDLLPFPAQLPWLSPFLGGQLVWLSTANLWGMVSRFFMQLTYMHNMSFSNLGACVVCL